MPQIQTIKIPKLRFPGFSGEWEEKVLGELGTIQRGKSKHRPRDAEFLYGGKYPFVQTGDIRKANTYLTEFTQTYSEAGLKQSKLREKDTLCITIAANIAETAILSIQACFPDSIIGFIADKEKTTAIFIKSCFDLLQVEIQKKAEGVAQDNLNLEKLNKVIFTVPSLPEQTKIASFLTGVDKKIDNLTALKSQRESYKKGVIQQIFSQQIRFKDGHGEDFPEWEEKSLSDTFTALKGQGLSKDDLDQMGKYKCILYGELYTTYPEIINQIKSKTNKEEGLKSKKGDLLIPCSTTTTGIDLANITELDEDSVLIGGDITVLRFKSSGISRFFAYYLTHYKKFEIAKYAQGSTIVHLYRSHFSKIKVSILSLPEQQKIANFLSQLDEKIGELDKQVEEVKQRKKGLLQGLFI